jgi:hypothetical protein
MQKDSLIFHFFGQIIGDWILINSHRQLPKVLETIILALASKKTNLHNNSDRQGNNSNDFQSNFFSIKVTESISFPFPA